MYILSRDKSIFRHLKFFFRFSERTVTWKKWSQISANLNKYLLRYEECVRGRKSIYCAPEIVKFILRSERDNRIKQNHRQLIVDLYKKWTFNQMLFFILTFNRIILQSAKSKNFFHTIYQVRVYMNTLDFYP